MPLAAWSVHELRYLLAFGGGTGRALSQQGHSYLALAMPVTLVLAALALGGFLLRCARAWGDGVSGRSPGYRTRRLWAISVAGLLAIYTSQELLEGLLATGHPLGLAGVFGHGGWWAGPAALIVGAAVALLLRGASAMETLLSRRTSRVARSARPAALRLPVSPTLVLQAPLARRGAGRAPPFVAIAV
jgi:hypothetical protein